MSAISGSVIQCVGEQVFFALDLNEIFSRELHTHSASGSYAGVRCGWATSICLHRDRHCSALTRSRLQRHLNHLNGFIIWSLRHKSKDYYDCVCPAPVISVCVAASQGQVSLWLKKPLSILTDLQKQNCSPQGEDLLRLLQRNFRVSVSPDDPRWKAVLCSESEIISHSNHI